MSKKPNDNIAIVLTGASRGLGQRICDALRADGLGRRILISRKPIPCFDGDEENLIADLAEPKDWKFEIEPTAGSIVFINNAGSITPINRSVNLSYGEIQKNHMVNFTNPFFISVALARIAQERKIPFYVINISSGAAKRAVAGWLPYCTSKAAMLMALEVLQLENDHVHVVNFDPGVMSTDMQKTIREQGVADMPDVERFIAYESEGKLKEPAQVAEEIVRLIKDEVQ